MSSSLHEPGQGVRLTYTIPEAAAVLGVSEGLLWKHIRIGQLPVLRIGRRTLVSRALIEGMVPGQPGGTAHATEAGAEPTGPRLLREDGS